MSTPVEAIAGLTIGTVEGVSATEITVNLERDAPTTTALNAGVPQGFPRINGYVLVPNEAGALVGLISRISKRPGLSRGKRPNDGGLPLQPDQSLLAISPIGTLETRRLASADDQQLRLRRGVTVYPSVGDPVLVPTPNQLRAVVEAIGVDTRVTIGSAPYASDASVTVDPDKLFGRHLAVFGNTGSGKSCTVAGLMRWSIISADDDPSKSSPNVNARFIVLDPNGEYLKCFSDLKDKINVRVFSVEPPAQSEGIDELFVPAWMWSSEEWSTLLQAQPGAQRPVLMQALRLARDAGARTAAISGNGDDAGNGDPSGSLNDADLMLTSVVSGCKTWMGSLVHGETKAYATFPGFKGIHQQLSHQAEFVAGKLSEISEGAVQPAEGFIAKIEEVVARRTDGQYQQGFSPTDFEEIIVAAEEILSCFPQSVIAPPLEEGAPSFFDPRNLPSIIESVAVARGGNVVQTVDFLKLRLESMLADERLAKVIAPLHGGSSFPDWLEELIGRSDDEHCGQVTVLDLSLVPSDALATIISVIARIVFEVAQRHRRLPGNELMPTVLVLEEAHNFVQRQSGSADEAIPARQCRQVFEKIAKEGRKFGLGLVLSSQRPAELSPTVVAQCNSFLLHRIVNDRDQDLIRRLIPDSAGSVLSELPTLPAQQAILLGLAAEVPVIVDIRNLAREHCPQSENPKFWDTWTGRKKLDIDFSAIAAKWRQ